MSREALPDGIVYTETVVHTAPERYVDEAPYQIGIINIPGQGRITARILNRPGSGGDARGQTALIGDHVSFAEWRDGVPYFSLIEK